MLFSHQLLEQAKKELQVALTLDFFMRLLIYDSGDGDATACPSLSFIFGFSRWGMLMQIDAYDYDSVVLAPILPAIPGVEGTLINPNR